MSFVDVSSNFAIVDSTAGGMSVFQLIATIVHSYVRRSLTTLKSARAVAAHGECPALVSCCSLPGFSRRPAGDLPFAHPVRFLRPVIS
jgi:hypothetical protein